MEVNKRTEGKGGSSGKWEPGVGVERQSRMEQELLVFIISILALSEFLTMYVLATLL